MDDKLTEAREAVDKVQEYLTEVQRETMPLWGKINSEMMEPLRALIPIEPDIQRLYENFGAAFIDVSNLRREFDISVGTTAVIDILQRLEARVGDLVDLHLEIETRRKAGILKLLHAASANFTAAAQHLTPEQAGSFSPRSASTALSRPSASPSRDSSVADKTRAGGTASASPSGNPCPKGVG